MLREISTVSVLCATACGSASSSSPGPQSPGPQQAAAIERRHFDPRKSGYSNAVRVGQTIFIAGQLPRDDNGKVPADPEEQVRLVWKNVERMVTMAGGTLQDIVHTQTFITKTEYGQVVNKVRTELFPKNAPTSTKLTVAGLACGECVVEINAIAIVDTKLIEVPPPPPSPSATPAVSQPSQSVTPASPTPVSPRAAKP